MYWRFNMTICFCLSTLLHGGAERVVVNVCNNLCASHNVYIILLSGNSTESAYFVDEKVHVLSLEKEYCKSFRQFKKVKPLAKLLKSLNPDAVVSFLPFVNVICHFACKKAKIVHITSERNDPRYDPDNKILRFLKEHSMKKSQGLVCQTEEFKNYYVKKGFKNVSVISNPVFIDASLKVPNVSDRKKQIVFAGRLEPQKNVYLLLNAFKEVKLKHPDYSLLIFGDGSEKESLERFSKDTGLEDVYFKGPSKEWHKIANESRMFVLCSDYEGMPNSLLEAMCLGVPCVSTRYSTIGPAFIIEDGINGLICEKNDVSDLCNSLNKLIESDALCDQFTSKNKDLRNNFEIQTISRIWETFITNTIFNSKIK